MSPCFVPKLLSTSFLTTRHQITLTNDPAVRTNQTADRIWISYQKLQSTVTAGSRILLDDGAVEVEVLSKGKSTCGY